jgi:tetratricopeptide (TPR) repeat protein
LLLLDYWPLNRFTRPAPAAGGAGPVDRPGNFFVPPRLIVEKIPLLVLSVALCVATVLVERIGIQPVEIYPLPLRIGNALISCVAYMWQMIYPARLAVLYPYPVHGLPVWEIITAILVLVAISAGVFIWRRTRPYLLVGWLWYLGILVPVIGLIQVGLQARADRHTYLPQIGLYVLLTWAVADLCAGWRHRRVVLGGLATVILVALILCARTQTSYWRNSETLFRHALAVTENNSLACNNLGVALAARGRLDEAIQSFRQAIQINSNRPETFFHLGMTLDQSGRTREAVAQDQQALRLNPNLIEALNNLAWILAASPDDQLRNGTEAVSLAERACELTHYGQPVIIGTLAAAYAEAGRFPEAVTTAEKAEQLATSAGLTAVAAKNRQLLELYRAGKPYHESPPTASSSSQTPSTRETNRPGPPVEQAR